MVGASPLSLTSSLWGNMRAEWERGGTWGREEERGCERGGKGVREEERI